MRLLIGLCATFVIASAAPASARWQASGTGDGAGTVATMPTAGQPSGAASGTTVTVSWNQNTFLGSFLGTYAGGGYALKRYALGSGTSVTPNASCATTMSGSGSTLQCIESGVPYGRWQYSVTPVLNTFTGTEGAKSSTVDVATAAPTLSGVAAQNPGSGETTGAIQVTWGAVTGATGYNVYRRTAAGSFDFNSPLNGSTPITATTLSDPGSGLSGGTTYFYVVRATAGSPAAESASSNALSATAIARPAAPASVTATAASGARIDVAWPAVSGATGYNVYRRLAAGSYNFSAPLNGATPVASATYADTTAVNASQYFYVVRAVILGAGSAQVESASSTESNAATADGVAPPAPSAVSVTGGGNLQGSAICSVVAGTRFINNAGKAAVPVTATIAAPESGETVVFTATTPGSTPVTVTVAAGSTSVSTTMNLTSLLDGAITLTAQTKDTVGNTSSATGPTNVVVKDTTAGALSNVTYTNITILADKINGTSECGASILAAETAPNTHSYSLSPVGSGGTFTLTVDAVSLGAYSYNVTATDLAGNTSAVTVVSGNDLV